MENAYRKILALELRKIGLEVKEEVSVPITYEGLVIDVAYRADLIVEKKVIVELKSIELVKKVHKKQLLTYLRLSDIRLGLLINFGAPLIKHGITRIVNGLKE